MNKYENGKIYKIVCNITNEIYIGSTVEILEERLRKHINKKDCISRNILDRGDYEIILIKNYPCSNKKELLWEERKHIENNICINKNLPIITEEEDKQYRKNYRDNNKDKNKIYQDRHRDKKNKKAAEKISCPICDLVLRRDSIRKHIKRKHT